MLRPLRMEKTKLEFQVTGEISFRYEISGPNRVTIRTEWTVLPITLLRDRSQYRNPLSCYEHWGKLRNKDCELSSYPIVLAARADSKPVSCINFQIYAD